MEHGKERVRAVALVGPAGAGKTSLAEAMLYAAGAVDRQGSVAGGTSIGDASPEARSRGGSTELNLYRLDYLDDCFALVDAPGAPAFAADATRALAACDLAVVVVDPDPTRAALVGPTLRLLDRLRLPHILFVNKIDAAKGTIRGLLEALQPLSAEPLVARQIPIREGEKITGFVDLALERAWHYRAGKPSEPIPLPDTLKEREAADRFHLLETLADHDDALLEQLIADEPPSLATIFSDLERETGANLVVPVLFGSAANGWGVRRLLKCLRHDVPHAQEAASRLNAAAGLFVFKLSYGNAAGRLALARLFETRLGEGAELIASDGRKLRAGTLFAVQGGQVARIAEAQPGAIVAIAKMEGVAAGDLLGTRAPPADGFDVPLPTANHLLAIAARDHKDEVRLSAALNKLAEEDPALSWSHDEGLRQTLLRGIDEEHLGVAIERLKRRYGVAVETARPAVPYRETVRETVVQRGRHKKQSGGHGQFGDVMIELRPLARGEGFRFEERITGGAVPKQWIPAVEQGVRDALQKGPLGFPVVDVAVTLTDGSYHSVDSSELAFRTAGRIAAAEALAKCRPYLLEPIWRVTVRSPSAASSRIGSTIASRRGQILGLGPSADVPGWDEVEALLPEAELHDLGAELRSASQGLASYEARFDHLAEVNGKIAGDIVQRVRQAA